MVNLSELSDARLRCARNHRWADDAPFYVERARDGRKVYVTRQACERPGCPRIRSLAVNTKWEPIGTWRYEDDRTVGKYERLPRDITGGDIVGELARRSITGQRRQLRAVGQ